MNEAKDWRSGVIVRRAAAVTAGRAAGGGRATIFDFAGPDSVTGIGGTRTWIGSVSVPPQSNTGPHHHGRHEVTIYVVAGRSEIRWGERLEYAAEIGPGDAVYFAPFVPHQERSLESDAPVEYLVVRSDNEKIAIRRDDITPVERPDLM